MIFSRIIYSAVLIGLVVGSIQSCLQMIGVDPIIFAAERYESPDPAETASTAPESAASPVTKTGHSHDHVHGWGPGDGAERTFYTFVSNILASIGFAAILLAIMSQFQLMKNRQITWPQGIIWGLAGFAALYLAPALGLPPEIPGIEAAPIENRQLWWGLTVICVSVGLGFLAFAPRWHKVLGVIFLALPYVIGAPHVSGPEFTHSDPSVVSALTELHREFIIVSGITNLAFWVILGLACTFAFNRWLRKAAMATDYANA